jgi:hypothetical protein
VVVVSLLGSALVAQAAGWWSVSGKDIATVPGSVDPEDIKGWMTLQQVSDMYGMPLPELLARIGAPASQPPDTALKDLEGVIDGFEMDLVREQVVAYLAESGATASATATPEASAPPDAAPVAVATPASDLAPAADAAVSWLPADQIGGTMTLRDVSGQCGIPLATLLEELGLPGDVPASTQLKEVAGQYGVEVTTVKAVAGAWQAANP